MNMTKEKVTRGELIACESYADNGALSHYTFVDENGDIIGIFCDEDALIKNRMEREKAYAILFAAAPAMYKALQAVCSDCESLSDWEVLFNIGRPDGTQMPPCPCKDCYVEKALKKARGEK